MDDLIKEAYLSRLEDCLPVDFSDGVKFGVGLCKDKKYTEEDLRKAFKYGIEMEAGIESFDYKNYPDGFSQFINSLNKDYEK